MTDRPSWTFRRLRTMIRLWNLLDDPERAYLLRRWGILK